MELLKRMNRMLMDKERSMLSGARLTQEFWAEAVNTAKYLVNRSPSSTLVDLTPHEVWFGKNHSLSHLKVFVVMHLCMFPRKRGTSWTRRKSSVFSSNTRME
jgi:hypothetical protein